MKKNIKSRGLTLIEVMVTVAVLMFAVLGAMGYRYYSAFDARKADEQITAGRIGLLLLEGWRGSGGRLPPDYDPASLAVPAAKLQIYAGAAGPPVAGGFTLLGTYAAVSEGANYYATLSFQDEDVSNPADGLLDVRILCVEVAWLRAYPTGNYSATDRTVKLTTKVGLP